MGSFVVALCFTCLVYICVDGTSSCEVCECDLCHDRIDKLTPKYCSSEKKFVIGLTKVSWYQALENCETEGYKLASITSLNETKNLLAYIKKMENQTNTNTNETCTACSYLAMRGKEDSSFWVSGTDQHDEGKHVWWTSPATPFQTYTNWYPGSEPNDNNDDEDCVEVWAKGTWNDRQCYKNLYYVCEYYLSV